MINNYGAAERMMALYTDGVVHSEFEDSGYESPQSLGHNDTTRRDFAKLLGFSAVAAAAGGCGSELSKQDIPRQHQYAEGDYRDKIWEKMGQEWDEGNIVGWTLDASKLVFATANDCVELPAKYIAGLVGGVFGGYEGKVNWERFVSYIADGLPGGESTDEVTGLLLQGNLRGAMDYLDAVEDSDLGAQVKTGLILASQYTLVDSIVKWAFGGENWLVRQDSKSVIPPVTGRPGPTPPPG